VSPRVAQFILETSNFFLVILSFHHHIALYAAFYMFLVSVLYNALYILVPLSLLSSSYLYLYPVFHLCAFLAPKDSPNSAFLNTLRQHTYSSHNASKIAPFRLLALSNPELLQVLARYATS
jgi:hypothetical protein